MIFSRAAKAAPANARAASRISAKSSGVAVDKAVAFFRTTGLPVDPLGPRWRLRWLADELPLLPEYDVANLSPVSASKSPREGGPVDEKRRAEGSERQPGRWITDVVADSCRGWV